MRHDVFTMRQIAACGLNTLRQTEYETSEQFQYRLYLTALQTGDIFLLLGSLLVPEGMDPLEWNPEIAAQTGNFLAALTDQADKAKLRILLASALMPFFLGGRRSFTTFRKSSSRPESDRPHIENAAMRSTETGA